MLPWCPSTCSGRSGGPTICADSGGSVSATRTCVLLQAEYRWEIFTAVDGALFYDAGTLASRPSELSLGNLDTDYGIGFRFGTKNGVFLRIEAAFGSREGKHFILRYGHVF